MDKKNSNGMNRNNFSINGYSLVYNYFVLTWFIFTLAVSIYGIIDGILNDWLFSPVNGSSFGVVILFIISLLYIIRFYQYKKAEHSNVNQ